MQITELRSKIQTLVADGLKWRAIHAEVVKPECWDDVSVATVWKIGKKRDYEPKDEAIRDALNLDKESQVLFLDGTHRPLSQALRAEPCACGQWFVSNHPRRGKCFECSPYRGKLK